MTYLEKQRLRALVRQSAKIALVVLLVVAFMIFMQFGDDMIEAVSTLGL